VGVVDKEILGAKNECETMIHKAAARQYSTTVSEWNRQTESRH